MSSYGVTMSQSAVRAPSATRVSGFDHVRDTIDSIIVAFILAFVFRAFIVEAFIIPTGSMGPTLCGLHGQLRCSNCAYSFSYNLPPEREVTAQPFQVICPNCECQNTISASRSQPLLGSSGDRILVLKWPYDLGGPLLGPHRWDVVVFKAPIKQPPDPDGKTNYIKRLTGLPNEVLEIIDGDVYTAPADKLPPELLRKLDPRDRKSLTNADFAALDRVLRIQRKTPVAQSAVWMLHHDHDCPPQSASNETPDWTPAKPSGAWITHVAGPNGRSSASPRLVFRGGDREEFIELTGRPLRDRYGYNSALLPSDDEHRVPAGRGFQNDFVTVGDARLEFVLDPTGDDARGKMTISLSKDNVEFLVRLGADGKAELCRISPERPGYEELLHTASVKPWRANRPVSIAVENVDYRVGLEVDGQRVLETTDSEYSPNPGALRNAERQHNQSPAPRCRIRIGASAAPLELWHVKVLRDVYYRAFCDGRSNMERAWGTCGSPIWLRDGEYFVCGDNSPQSKDARLWTRDESNDLVRQRGDDYQVGTVPADQMVGRAFFVYWPAGKRLNDASGPPVIPNAGRMRFIR